MNKIGWPTSFRFIELVSALEANSQMCRRVLARLLMAETSVSDSHHFHSSSQNAFTLNAPVFPSPPRPPHSRIHFIPWSHCLPRFIRNEQRQILGSCSHSACCRYWDTSFSSSLSLRCPEWSHFSFFFPPELGQPVIRCVSGLVLRAAATRDYCLSALGGNSGRGFPEVMASAAAAAAFPLLCSPACISQG